MGSQSTVKSKATAPFDEHSVATIAVVPRHATKTALASVTVANASNLKHDICYNAKKSTVATCATTPLRSIPMDQASFFTQVATTAVVSKAA